MGRVTLNIGHPVQHALPDKPVLLLIRSDRVFDSHSVSKGRYGEPLRKGVSYVISLLFVLGQSVSARWLTYCQSRSRQNSSGNSAT